MAGPHCKGDTQSTVPDKTSCVSTASGFLLLSRDWEGAVAGRWWIPRRRDVGLSRAERMAQRKEGRHGLFHSLSEAEKC